MKTIFEKSQEKQKAYSLPKNDPAFQGYSPPKNLQRKTPLLLPEISELDLMRHFSSLAERNLGIDTAFYPLGSCTMKYNPRVNEMVAAMPEFSQTHPLASEETIQGTLELTHSLIQKLCQLCGMSAGSLTPNAGAQGEFMGIKMIAAYHQSRGNLERNEMLIPDNAHGTNPATATMAGFKTVSLRTDTNGDLDLVQLRSLVSNKTAGLMLTNPNTLGLFSSNIVEASQILHSNGALLYYDGANLNAIMNIVRPGDMGFDVMHINLHKTFSTPHGGGGPGSGPILCNDKLKAFLPTPIVYQQGSSYKLCTDNETSIGAIATFHGNFAIYLRAYLYFILHGHYGLRRVSEMAVLNANYLKARLAHLFTIPFPQFCMHEFVVQADNYLDQGIKAYDIAKRLLDYGHHAPTVYFPLIVKECMLIEPTETESKATLDQFVSDLEKIIDEISRDPELLKNAPDSQAVRRLDEVRAAKHPILKHQIQ